MTSVLADAPNAVHRKCEERGMCCVEAFARKNTYLFNLLRNFEHLSICVYVVYFARLHFMQSSLYLHCYPIQLE